ncbi:DUF302 domain-containing protein [Salinibacterium sp. NSLL150]|uniref:DUF302 domain-containing protein n=1 Tax=unclassified Salinibacterium TaxID=2632331 RepID=UPI0018CD3169|nr:MULTISPECIES: DUF302 domain-containing protein [unclassified Salinibacterium]MBH0099402.1 DUF302 domain-containing protein [Salinibacterium sp. NSLL35]MBH0102156.1 DUF302 domain-containing protein [Salinibacterium sp. NSLL150]MBH0104916.1 DUF302 domain-containing protein [Salinibacterium sp. NSLL16]MBH0107676.1 DUF302 domain-containing protein [Salinibacterium sp. NSLL17]
MNYALTVTVPLPYEEAISVTKHELANQGFGVLTEIDIRATFTTKLGAESADAVGDYLILGACNPALAEQALAADPDMGLLLPCNVVIRRSQSAESTTVQTINPQTMVQLSEVAAVQAVADQADERLRAALAAIEGASGK